MRGRKREGGCKSGHMDKQFDYWYGGHGHLTFYPKTKHKIFKNARAGTQIEILDEGMMNFLNPNEAFLDGARQFLKRRPSDKPFCLLVNFNVPHSAGTRSMKKLPSDPELYRTTYRDKIDAMPIPETYIVKKDIVTPKIPRNAYSGKYLSSYAYVKTLATLREHEVRECQTITGIDHLVGHLVDELTRQGLADNTIIVYSSDHGIQHGEHGLGGKVLLYEESIRVPIIIYDPRLPEKSRGRRISQFALNVDLAPTLLDLCGVKAPDGIQGRSLAPLMRGENVDWRDDFFCENMFMGQNYPRIEAIRNKQFKYIRYFDKKKDKAHHISLTASICGEKPVYEELFDLQSDPKETTNLAQVEAHADTLSKLRLRCQELVSELRGDDPPDTHRGKQGKK
ncbi:MAG: sulfatase/phosphatase domain-containing protein [Planctomycetota bacterium]